MNPVQFSEPSIDEQIRQAIISAIPDAEVEVNGSSGHFNIAVTSSVFAGKTTLNKQRLVYSAISRFMTGPDAPVHAVDSMRTMVPDQNGLDSSLSQGDL